MQHAAAQSKDFSLGIDSDSHLPVLIALLRRREKVLAPILLPGHWTIELHRRGGDDGLLRIERRFGAKAAAYERRDHANRFKTASEQVRERCPGEMRRLCRRPNRQKIARSIVTCQDRATLQRHRRAAMSRNFFFKYTSGARKCCFNVSIGNRDRCSDVACNIAVHTRSARCHCVAAIADASKSFEVDAHRGRAILSRMPALGHDNSDDFADIRDLLACQWQLGARGRDEGTGHEHRDAAPCHTCRKIAGRKDRAHGRHTPRL